MIQMFNCLIQNHNSVNEPDPKSNKLNKNDNSKGRNDILKRLEETLKVSEITQVIKFEAMLFTLQSVQHRM